LSLSRGVAKVGFESSSWDVVGTGLATEGSSTISALALDVTE